MAQKYYLGAYGEWIRQGHVGTEDDFLAWLKGETGEGFAPEGIYATLIALQADVTDETITPTQGQVWMVGSSEPYEYYMWDDDTDDFVSLGDFVGDTGATGSTGATGAKGDKGDKGDTGLKGDTGAQGLQGVKGDKGDKGDMGASITSAAFVVNDIVFTKDDANTVTLANAAVTLKGDNGDTGLKGDTGLTGQGYTWKAAYAAETAYAPYDTISYNGSSYVCKLASTGNLPTNATFWDLVAQKGTDGLGAGDMLKATYDTTNTGTKVDTAINAEKVNNLTVLTAVPSGALFTDTVYTHPATHSIAEVSGLQTALDGKVDDSQVLTDVPSGALFTDTVYTHPTTAGNKHIPSGGASNQVLKYTSDGTAVWGTDADTIYTHPTGDGNSHVPANSTTNNGKVLTASGTAGTYTWESIPADANKVDKATFDAHTILYATTDNTPAALAVGAGTVVGRASSGSIAALSIDTDLSSVSASDDTIPSAKATKTALDGKAASSHNQAASTITTGTLAGKTLANATSQETLADTQIRNIYSGTTDMTAGSTSLDTGTIYLVYTA